MRRARNLFGAVLASVAMATVATACDPAPRLVLSVDSTAAGADDSVGDGVCSSSAAGGACTLQAALQEGDQSASGADIHVPAGVYPGADSTITGDVTLLGAVPGGVTVGPAHLTVSAGAKLAVHRIGAVTGDFNTSSLRFTVHGTALLSQVDAGSLDGPALTVGQDGSAWLTDSSLFGVGPGALVNDGTAYAVRSSLHAGGRFGIAISTGAEGTTHLAATYVGPITSGSLTNGGCDGTDPISHGYVHTFSSLGCSLEGSATDTSGDPGSGTGSVLVDAVPLGSTWCAAGGSDLMGTPRGNDGDSDGTPGCDIGAIEYTP